MPRIVFRPKKFHLPKRILRDSCFEDFKDEIVAAWDIKLHHSNLACKTVIFSSRASMRRFHKRLVDLGIETTLNGLGKHCAGFVCKLAVEVIEFHKDGRQSETIEVDPRYFAICCLVEGFLNVDILMHESVHVGFAYDYRKRERNKYLEKGDLHEEGICYPAGVYARILTRLISTEGIRAIGGDSKRWRDSWDREIHKGYLHAFLHWWRKDNGDATWLERFRKALVALKKRA